MILGAVWNLKGSGKGQMFYDQSRELTAIDASTKVLDICGQRNAFARKYSILIKDLRQQLSKGLRNTEGDMATPSSVATCVNSLNMTPCYPSPLRSFQPLITSNSIPESQLFQNITGTTEPNSTSATSLPDEDIGRGYYTSFGSFDTGLNPWPEQSGISYPMNDTTPYGTLVLILPRKLYTDFQRSYELTTEL